MNVSADQVRAATRAAAAVITADKVPPLRLDQPPPSRQSAPPGPTRRIRLAWVAPLAAAAAVVLAVAASLAIGSLVAKPGKSRPGNPGALTLGASAGPYAGVPPYYVAVASPSLVAVRATATGATLASITTPTPVVGVTGAADDRTFVLAAQRQATAGSARWWSGQPEFYLLRLTASGAEESFTRLAIPAPTGTTLTGLALSPDGSKLAVEANSGGWPHPGLLEIRVYTLATGAFRTWRTNGSIDPDDPYGLTGTGVHDSQSISWAADSRTVAFDWVNQASIRGTRLLDTTASGDNLIADSRLAVQAPPASNLGISRCMTNSVISLDGSAIVCGYTRIRGVPDAATGSTRITTTTELIRYSTRTGKPILVFGVYQFQGPGGNLPYGPTLCWANSTGKVLIAGVVTRSGVRFGVISGEKFTPLPGITSLGAAAW